MAQKKQAVALRLQTERCLISLAFKDLILKYGKEVTLFLKYLGYSDDQSYCVDRYCLYF